jgi:5-methylcytosine-specific restriction endonuclease McrA
MTTRRMTYLEYLESREWWTKRQHILQRAGYRCERCGGVGPLDVHHRSYADLGCEDPEDLEALCAGCHGQEHEPKNRAIRVLEQSGQARLFDRWDDPDPPATMRKRAA